MINLILCSSLLLISVNASGELNILTHPNSIQFKGHDHLKESLLTEVYSAALGFSTEEDSNWQGMYLLDPFNLAKAIVTVTVDGISSLDVPKGHNFPLRTDEDEGDIFTMLERRVEDRYPETSNYLVRIDLSEGLDALMNYKDLQGIKSIKIQKANYNYLKNSIEEDKNFLRELAFLNAIADQVERGSITSDNIPDIFWFKVTALHALSDLHGATSMPTKEAKLLLSTAISRLNNAFKKVYSEQMIFSVITSDASHTRRIRRATNSKADEDDFTNLNLAEVYSDNYPVIFNIILWFGVAFIFSLLAISIFIGDMDPGRDSIIYRMTSTRMKKDN